MSAISMRHRAGSSYGARKEGRGGRPERRGEETAQSDRGSTVGRLRASGRGIKGEIEAGEKITLNRSIDIEVLEASAGRNGGLSRGGWLRGKPRSDQMTERVAAGERGHEEGREHGAGLDKKEVRYGRVSLERERKQAVNEMSKRRKQ